MRPTLVSIALAVLVAFAAPGCVEQERRTHVGSPGYWNTTANPSSGYNAGVPRLTPGSQRVQTSNMRLSPAVPDIMEHDSDFVGVRRGK